MQILNAAPPGSWVGAPEVICIQVRPKTEALGVWRPGQVEGQVGCAHLEGHTRSAWACQRRAAELH